MPRPRGMAVMFGRAVVKGRRRVKRVRRAMLKGLIVFGGFGGEVTGSVLTLKVPFDG